MPRCCRRTGRGRRSRSSPTPRTTSPTPIDLRRRATARRCPCETRTYELTGLALPAGSRPLRASTRSIDRGCASRGDIAYEADRPTARCRRRLIEHVRTLYRRDDLHRARCRSASSSRWRCRARATSWPSRRACSTQVFGDARRPTRCSADEAATCTASRRRRLVDAVGPQSSSRRTPATRRRRSWPTRASTSSCRAAYRDPFGNVATIVDYDAHDLLPIADARRRSDNTRRSVGQRLPRAAAAPASPTRTATGPRSPSTRSGMVVGTAVMGKPSEGARATRSTGFAADLDDDAVAGSPADPLADPHAHPAGAPPRGSSTTCSPTSAREPTRSRSRPWSPRWRARRTPSDLGAGEPTQRPAQLRLLRRLRPRDPEEDPGRARAARRRRARRRPALGRQRLDHLQQQGQAGPAVRAVLQRHAPLRVRRAASASARCCSTTRSSASSPRCTRTTPGRRWSSTRGGRRPGTSTTRC